MNGPLSLFCSMATLYLLGIVAYCGYMVTERGLLLRFGKGAWILGFLCHSFFLAFSVAEAGRVPTAGIFEASTFFAWAIILAATLSSFLYRIRLLGAFVLPLSFFLVLLASFQNHKMIFGVTSQPLYFGLHTVFLFLSYAAFALAGITGLMYLILERQIKRKRTGRFYRWLPSLELLENANSRFLRLGTPLFVMGVLFGLLWSQSSLGYFVGNDPKIVFASLTLLLYGSLFLAETFHWIHGRKVMKLSVLYFLWVVVTFIGIQHSATFMVLRIQ